MGGGSGREYITVLCKCSWTLIKLLYHSHYNNFSNLGCGSAAGERLPPFVVYKAKHLYDTWKHGGPAGALYGVSSSGWMEGPNFISWFKKLFLKNVECLLSDGPVILFVDGHHSHIDLELIYTAKEHNVHLMCLPPNLTHIIQLLDVSVFCPLKRAYSNILKEYKTHTLAAKLKYLQSNISVNS